MNAVGQALGWPLARPRLVAAACIWFMAWAILFVADIPLDLLPETAPAELTIATQAPGLVAEQVEDLVTRPIETRLIGGLGVAHVHSQSVQGLSSVTVEFIGGSDPFRARQAAAEALGGLTGALPAGVEPPRIAPLTPTDATIMDVAFMTSHTGATAARDLRDLVQWTVRPHLLATPGVAKVSVYGGESRRLEVRARPADLSDSDLGFLDILTAVRRATGVAGAGFIDTDGQRVLIEPHGQALTPDDIGAGQIQTPGAAPVRIEDVSDVSEVAAPAFGDALIDGRPGVLVEIDGQYGANRLRTAAAVDKAMDALRPLLRARGVTARLDIDRPSRFAAGALRAIGGELAIGLALIAAATLAFTRDIRGAAISIICLPLAMLTAVVVLKLIGMSLNLMTLGGLALGLGVMIDDAVIDVENIRRRLRRDAGTPPTRAAAVVAGALEVRGPVILATLAVLIAMAPLLTLTGPAGGLLRPLAAATLAGCAASLLVATLVTPSLCLLFLGGVGGEEESIARAPGRTAAACLAAARSLSARPTLVFGGVGMAIIASLVVAVGFRFQPLPDLNDGRLLATLRAPPGTSLSVMRDYGARLAAALAPISGVRAVSERIGRDPTGDDSWGPERARLDLALADGLGVAAQARVAGRTRATLGRFPGLDPVVEAGFDSEGAAAQPSAPFRVTVFGQDLDATRLTALDIAARLRAIPGAGVVRLAPDALAPVMRVDLDFQRLALYGLSAADVLDTVQAAFAGETVGHIYAGGRVIDLAVGVQTDLRLDPEGIGRLLLRSTSGVSAPLSSVANVYLTEGRAIIEHEDGLRRQVVTASPVDGDGFEAKARRAISRDIPAPTGGFIAFDSAREAAVRGARDLAIAYGFAAFAMLAVLAIGYDARTGAIVLSSTLFALPGAVVAIALMGGVISLGAIVGMLALFGLSMRNAILVFSRLETLILADLRPWGLETVLTAVRERLSALILTTALTALGVTPLALNAGGPGHEILGPMAIVVLAGLTTGTLAAVFIQPAIILFLWRPEWARGGRRPPGAAEPPA